MNKLILMLVVALFSTSVFADNRSPKTICLNQIDATDAKMIAETLFSNRTDENKSQFIAENRSNCLAYSKLTKTQERELTKLLQQMDARAQRRRVTPKHHDNAYKR